MQSPELDDMSVSSGRAEPDLELDAIYDRLGLVGEGLAGPPVPTAPPPKLVLRRQFSATGNSAAALLQSTARRYLWLKRARELAENFGVDLADARSAMIRAEGNIEVAGSIVFDILRDREMRATAVVHPFGPMI